MHTCWLHRCSFVLACHVYVHEYAGTPPIVTGAFATVTGVMCAKCWVTHAASFSHAMGVVTPAGTMCTTTSTVSGSPEPELGAVALNAARPLGDLICHVVGTVMAIT